MGEPVLLPELNVSEPGDLEEVHRTLQDGGFVLAEGSLGYFLGDYGTEWKRPGNGRLNAYYVAADGERVKEISYIGSRDSLFEYYETVVKVREETH